MLIFILLLAVCIGVGLGISNDLKKKKKAQEAQSRSVSRPSTAAAGITDNPPQISQYELNQHILKMIDRDFVRIGWTSWDTSVHRTEGQFERLRRASMDKTISVVDYNFDRKTAIITGSSGKTYTVSESTCSCPDFRARSLPCKHMYHLAINLPDIIAKKQYTELANDVIDILRKYLSDEISVKEADSLMLQINLRLGDSISTEDLGSNIPEQISDSIYDVILMFGKQVLDGETEERKAILMNENVKLKRLTK